MSLRTCPFTRPFVFTHASTTFVPSHAVRLPHVLLLPAVLFDRTAFYRPLFFLFFAINPSFGCSVEGASQDMRTSHYSYMHAAKIVCVRPVCSSRRAAAKAAIAASCASELVHSLERSRFLFPLSRFPA